MCRFDGCIAPVRSGGLCASHYNQKQRGKELRPIKPMADKWDEWGRDCAGCHTRKPWHDYDGQCSGFMGYSSRCKKCLSEYRRNRRLKRLNRV